MRHVAVFLQMTILLALGLSPTVRQTPAIQLPQDRTAAVITMDYRGGFGPPRKDNRPALTILADGAVQIIDSSGDDPAINGTLSSEELQDLLRFAINEHHFFEFDEAEAQREVADEEVKAGFHFSTFDGATTIIRIRTAEHDHTARFYVLDSYAKAYPGAKLLTDLFSVEGRLQLLVNEAKAGGREAVAAALNLVNEYLKTAYPKIPALGQKDLLYVTGDTADRHTLVFVPAAPTPKQPETAEGRVRQMMMPEPQLSVEVEYVKGVDPTIRVSNPPQ